MEWEGKGEEKGGGKGVTEKEEKDKGGRGEREGRRGEREGMRGGRTSSVDHLTLRS